MTFSTSGSLRALEHRLLPHRNRVKIIEGDCVASIEDIASEIPLHSLNFALIDPFGPSGLRWSVLERLAQFPRMDLLIHFPTGSLKRNLHNHPDFNQMVGASESLSDVPGAHDVGKAMEQLRENLARLGYSGKQVRCIDIRNSKKTILYHLFFASKKQLADDIWSSIAKVDACGQRSLF